MRRKAPPPSVLLMRCGELLAGRFELLEDAHERTAEVRAVDRVTGRPVRWVPPFPRDRVHTSDLENLARDLMALQLAAVVPILHVGPGIVTDEPPPLLPRPRLDLADAADCVLQACEVLAHMHALGLEHLEWWELRLTRHDDGWRIAWPIPRWSTPMTFTVHGGSDSSGSPEPLLSDCDFAALFSRPQIPDTPLSAALRTLATRLMRPVPPKFPVSGITPRPTEPSLRPLKEFFIGLLGPGSTSAAKLPDGLDAARDVVAFARLVAPLVATPAAWARRIDALPVVRSLPRRRRDLDALVDHHEARIAQSAEKQVALDTAGALHQRACHAFAGGAAPVALADAERAVRLDPCVDYRVTRAVILDHVGRGAEARTEIAATIKHASTRTLLAAGEETFENPDKVVSRRELGRALTTAGLFMLHDDDVVLAERALRLALTVRPTAAAAHALGSALYRQGNTAGAAEFESLSVERAPNDPRYRWALVISLVRLGRLAEAREHADIVLRQDQRYRERCDRLFAAPSR